MANRTLILTFFVFAIIFVAGIYYIFSVRFSVGDVYPHYSSLRSDPLGCKILYEGLSSIPGNIVKRDHNTVPTWEGGKDTTLFILGLKSGVNNSTLKYPGQQNYKIISNLLSSGTKIVISLYPKALTLDPLTLKHSQDNEIDEDEKKKEKDKQDINSKKEKKPDYSFLKKWGFNIRTVDKEEMNTADLADIPENADLPASIKMYSCHYFTDLDDKWDILYTLKGNPVIISRKYGGGTIILCADSYFISNEAMVSDRYPGLLSWLVGPANEIYFDESHFGIQQDIGIIDLAYKYRLQGVLLTLILIAGLYIWKNTTPFIPPQDNNELQSAGIKAEKDHFDGLVSLLQRHVPVEDLVTICIKEWERSVVKEKAYVRSDLPSVKELEDMAVLRSKPSLIYNSICKKLTERKQI